MYAGISKRFSFAICRSCVQTRSTIDGVVNQQWRLNVQQVREYLPRPTYQKVRERRFAAWTPMPLTRQSASAGHASRVCPRLSAHAKACGLYDRTDSIILTE